MRPRPKNVKQILREKWPDQATPQKISSEYNSELSNELALYLPDNIKQAVSIVAFKNGLLELAVPTATQLMVLNTQRSQLISQLRKTHPNLCSVKCSVKPQLQNSSKTSRKSPVNKHSLHLSENSRVHIKAAMKNLPEELQSALTRLLDQS